MTPERRKQIAYALKWSDRAMTSTIAEEIAAYIEELEADRDRLEWMIARGATVGIQEGYVGYSDLCEVYERSRGLPSGSAETPRAAIDAARQSQQKPEGK